MNGKLSCLVSAFVIGSVTAVAQPDGAFHPAATEPEKALDSFLRIVGNDHQWPDNLFGGRGDEAFRKTVDYSKFLTAALIESISAAEKKLVNQQCGGKYVEGEICGLDFHPFLCASDISDMYLYRTEVPGRDETIISYTWPSVTDPTATYRLLKIAGTWQLDGISCGPPNTRFRLESKRGMNSPSPRPDGGLLQARGPGRMPVRLASAVKFSGFGISGAGSAPLQGPGTGFPLGRHPLARGKRGLYAFAKPCSRMMSCNPGVIFREAKP